MTSPAATAAVSRQVALPLSKAVEIAYKNIRMRLSRSLLVTSGIVLALAFLMAILANEAMVDSMRSWASAPAASQAERLERQKLESMMSANGLHTTTQ